MKFGFSSVPMVSGLLLLSLLAPFCKSETPDVAIPDGVPIELAPEDNPYSEAKARLGRLLFYDKRLSGDETVSCASCHDVALAFTDGIARSRGIPKREGSPGPRNAPNLTNTAFSRSYTWVNPALHILEGQAMVPLFIDNTVIEMGLAGKEEKALAKLKREPYYQKMFKAAFPGEKDSFHISNVIRAISSFERTFISFNSHYDRYQNGDSGAISDSAKRGEKLFRSAELNCAECHSGRFFTAAQEEKQPRAASFRDNGLHSSYPDAAGNVGISEVTHRGEDVGKFKVPTLRNVALTYPYMHDGSINCAPERQSAEATYSEECARDALKKVVEHYESGGKKSANQDPLIRGFKLSGAERDDLVEFLMTLTDQSFINNPFYQNPRPEDRFFGR